MTRFHKDRSGGITRRPKYVLAGSYAEVQRYSNAHRVPIGLLHFIDGPECIRKLPQGTRFELIRTGGWSMIDREKLAEIEFELRMRREWIG